MVMNGYIIWQMLKEVLFPNKATIHHHSPSFTAIRHSPLFTTLHHSSPLFTTLHHYSPLFTTIHHYSPPFTIACRPLLSSIQKKDGSGKSEIKETEWQE
ncbi:uncharacterized protein RHIMIDRAFT_296055, partial [Rhizopus microsporus ATCC 52813]